MVTVLLTGAGAPGTRGTLYALRENPDRRPVRIVGVDAKADCVGRYLVESFSTVPNPEDDGYLDALIDICVRESVDIVVPQTTREIELLSDKHGALAQRGIRTMVSDARAIHLANNKWRLLQEFEALGLPVPKYTIATSQAELRAAAEQLGYPNVPIVVKPPVSNGMRGVRVLREDAWDVRRFLSEKPSGLEISLDELLAILGRGNAWPPLLVTEFLPGTEYTVDLFMGSQTQTAIPRKRVAIRSGITFESLIELREDLCDFSIRAAQRIGLRYAVGFQYKLDAEGVPKVLESNPRVQGTMVASVFSGINVIWLSVRELLGEAPASIEPAAEDGRFYRFWGGIAVNGGAVAEI